MPLGRNEFFNPANGESYVWDINHGEEDERAEEVAIQATHLTGTGLPILQQGEITPDALKLKGTILKREQLDAMRFWSRFAQAQSIYFTDAGGTRYEVVITSFRYTRVRVAANPRGGALAPLEKWTYSLTMNILREGI